MSRRVLVIAEWSTFLGMVGVVVDRSLEEETAMVLFDGEDKPLCFGFEALCFLSPTDPPPPVAA